MLIEFFFCVRRYGVKTSITELLDLLAALERNVIFADVEAFYQLSRTILVKDESYYDRFDRAFADYFEGVAEIDIAAAIPEDWLARGLQRELTAADRKSTRL